MSGPAMRRRSELDASIGLSGHLFPHPYNPLFIGCSAVVFNYHVSSDHLQMWYAFRPSLN